MPVLQAKGAPVSGGNKCPCLGACAQPRGLEKTPPLDQEGWLSTRCTERDYTTSSQWRVFES